MISLDLTREQKRIVEKTRGLVREEITPKSLEIDAKGDDQFDWSIANLLSKHNLLCPTIPKEYGGLGMNHLTCALLIEEISTGCAGVATVLNASIHAASPIVLAGTREQKESFLPLLTSTTPALAAFALTEPEPVRTSNQFPVRLKPRERNMYNWHQGFCLKCLGGLFLFRIRIHSSV